MARYIEREHHDSAMSKSSKAHTLLVHQLKFIILIITKLRASLSKSNGSKPSVYRCHLLPLKA